MYVSCCDISSLWLQQKKQEKQKIACKKYETGVSTDVLNMLSELKSQPLDFLCPCLHHIICSLTIHYFFAGCLLVIVLSKCILFMCKK